MSAFKLGAKRSISDAQLASSEAGATSRLGCCLAIRLALEHEQQRKHLNGLCRVPCRRPGTPPGRASRGDRASALPPAGRAAACRSARRRDRFGPIPPGCGVLSASPRATGRRPPETTRRRRFAEASPAATSAPASNRMASRKPSPFSAAVRSTSRKCSIMRLSRSRSTSTQRPRTSASPSDFWPATLRISAAVNRSPSSVTSIWKSSSASWPSPDWRLAADLGGHLRARRPVGPPCRWHSNHHARALQLRDVSQELHGLVGRPPQRMEDLTCVDHGSSATGKSLTLAAREEAATADGPCLPRPHTRRRALPSGRCCALACADNRVV